MKNNKESLQKENLTNEALNTKLIELKKEAMNQRFEKATSGLAKTHMIRKNRRDIARIKTQISLNNKKEEK